MKGLPPHKGQLPKKNTLHSQLLYITDRATGRPPPPPPPPHPPHPPPTPPHTPPPPPHHPPPPPTPRQQRAAPPARQTGVRDAAAGASKAATHAETFKKYGNPTKGTGDKKQDDFAVGSDSKGTAWAGVATGKEAVAQAKRHLESQMPGDEKYAAAANGLVKPSSSARALLAGAQNIERTDCLVKTIAAQKGMPSDTVNDSVALVDAWLDRNRRAG